VRGTVDRRGGVWGGRTSTAPLLLAAFLQGTVESPATSHQPPVTSAPPAIGVRARFRLKEEGDRRQNLPRARVLACRTPLPRSRPIFSCF
jgi:hypothetical protein